jgi:hypothetical protein
MQSTPLKQGVKERLSSGGLSDSGTVEKWDAPDAMAGTDVLI